jgi:hypothetical protein
MSIFFIISMKVWRFHASFDTREWHLAHGRYYDPGKSPWMCIGPFYFTWDMPDPKKNMTKDPFITF